MPPRLNMIIVLALMFCTPAAAQTSSYPARPVRAIVGFVPGSATDIKARQLGKKLAEGLGQQVIVDSRPGGSGIIAATMARDAPPDRHTIFASPPEEFRRYIQNEIAKWTRLVKEAKIPIE